MKRLFYILFSLYFFTGSTLLPKGDFSALGEVADMYRHCKATEDHDMGLEDFITEHVFNLKIKDIFEKHRDEKQHSSDKPSPYQRISTNSIQIVHKCIDKFAADPSIKPFLVDVFFLNNAQIVINGFPSGIFRPPAIAFPTV